jgi:hypothetical protein
MVNASEILELNTKTYAVIWEVENVLRELIYESLTSTYGNKWSMRLSESPRDKVKEQFAYLRRNPLANRVVFQPLCYVDFPDLADTIKRADNWREIFQEIFRNKEMFVPALQSLDPIRNAIAHNRLVTISELGVTLKFREVLSDSIGDERYSALLHKALQPLNFSRFIKELEEVLLMLNDETPRNAVATVSLRLRSLQESRCYNLWQTIDDLSPIDGLRSKCASLADEPPGLPTYIWERMFRESQVPDSAKSAYVLIGNLRSLLGIC